MEHPKVIEFDGHKFRLYKGERYYRGYYKKKKTYLHIAIWEFHNGPVPKGFDVHHKDENPFHNDISNFELISNSKHRSDHTLKRAESDPEGFKKAIEAAREAARAWHGSEEGRRWHSEHGKQTWIGRETLKVTCIKCGSEYDVLRGTKKKGFCSPACQSAFRRDSGVDNEERKCVVCGSIFTVNRYSKTRTCSKDCWRKALSGPRKRI